jgi:predicted chitinase
MSVKKAMREFDVCSRARAQQFLAQVLHESAGLRYFEEIASGAAYEGRTDLGNTHTGDGRRFKGRGPMQLTGRANYRWAGKQLGLDLEAHPELAARHDIGWRIAGLYWHAHGLNALADRGDIIAITHIINGGENGLASRRAYLAHLERVDCRPIDPLAGYTTAERRWIREYDQLVTRHTGAPRRAVLRTVMSRQRKLIWRAAQTRAEGGDGRGWNIADRRQRYDSLLARST